MEFTNKNFQKEVLESKVPVLVDFWASWCGPCRMMAPIIEELEKEFKGKEVKIGKLNVDEDEKIAQQYHIMSIPTIIIFKNGRPVEQMVGVRGKEELAKKIEDLLKK
jgi:thioredoxin 1